MSIQSRIAASAQKVGLKMSTLGAGRPLLLLHGGAGPGSLSAFAKKAAEDFMVMWPSHPGYDGAERPSEIANVRDLARLYADIIVDAGLSDVIVMGFSMGGWVAAELALADQDHISRLILVDAVGIAVAEHKVLNVNEMKPADIPAYIFHRPEKFRVDPATLSPEARADMQANMATLAVYAEDHYMQDPTLAARLAGISTQTLVLWGENDQIVDLGYGRAYARSIPGAEFQLISESGHNPQIEQPALVYSALLRFAEGVPTH